MIGRILSRPLISSVLAMTLGLGAGCSHWIELAVPTEAAPPASITVATEARVPLLLETIRVTHNGSSIAPPAILELQYSVPSKPLACSLNIINQGTLNRRRTRLALLCACRSTNL